MDTWVDSRCRGRREEGGAKKLGLKYSLASWNNLLAWDQHQKISERISRRFIARWTQVAKK